MISNNNINSGSLRRCLWRDFLENNVDYNKTIIRFRFCDILNNQGLGKCYQPQPSPRLITLISTLITVISPDITKTSFNIVYYLRSRIISGPFWESFAVWRSFAVGDHLRYCTDLMSLMTSSLVTILNLLQLLWFIAVIYIRNYYTL